MVKIGYSAWMPGQARHDEMVCTQTILFVIPAEEGIQNDKDSV